MRVFNDTILSAGDMSQATLTSDVADCNHLSLICVIGSVPSATVAGTIKLQASIDQTTWVDIASATAAVSQSAAAGQYMIQIIDATYPYIRAVYTKTSGSGSLTLKINGKGF